MIWPPFQPPAWNAPAPDSAEMQQSALSAENSGLARELSQDSPSVLVLAKESGLGMGHLVKGLGVGVCPISFEWAGIHFSPLEKVVGIIFI